MRTTIDKAGRIVVPKLLRDEVGLDPGAEVDITVQDGRISIEPVSKPMRLVRRDGFLAAEIEGYDGPLLTTAEVRDLIERLRR